MPDSLPSEERWLALCNSGDLVDGGPAVSFDLRYQGLSSRAFAVRYQGQVHAYLNRCSHVAMEMDWQPDRFFDPSGRWLVCATHGALYEPDTGACRGGPCKRGLISVNVLEFDGVIHWRSQYPFQPLEF
jgi:nitrite reductase/ring-hydroxylating ferredoxin subunit